MTAIPGRGTLLSNFYRRYSTGAEADVPLGYFFQQIDLELET
jgi:hypothetical protein